MGSRNPSSSKLVKAISIPFDEDGVTEDDVEANLEVRTRPRHVVNKSIICSRDGTGPGNGDDSRHDFNKDSPKSRNDNELKKKPSLHSVYQKKISSSGDNEIQVCQESQGEEQPSDVSTSDANAVLQSTDDIHQDSDDKDEEKSDKLEENVSTNAPSTSFGFGIDTEVSPRLSRLQINDDMDDDAILSRADEIILEAKKACAYSPRSPHLLNKGLLHSSNPDYSSNDSITDADEVVQKMNIDDVPLQLSSYADFDADEIIEEARKMCAISPKSVELIKQGIPPSCLPFDRKTSANLEKDENPQKISTGTHVKDKANVNRNTQQLSTEEVLKLATQVLEAKKGSSKQNVQHRCMLPENEMNSSIRPSYSVSARLIAPAGNATSKRGNYGSNLLEDNAERLANADSAASASDIISDSNNNCGKVTQNNVPDDCVVSNGSATRNAPVVNKKNHADVCTSKLAASNPLQENAERLAKSASAKKDSATKSPLMLTEHAHSDATKKTTLTHKPRNGVDEGRASVTHAATKPSNSSSKSSKERGNPKTPKIPPSKIKSSKDSTTLPNDPRDAKTPASSSCKNNPLVAGANSPTADQYGLETLLETFSFESGCASFDVDDLEGSLHSLPAFLSGLTGSASSRDSALKRLDGIEDGPKRRDEIQPGPGGKIQQKQPQPKEFDPTALKRCTEGEERTSLKEEPSIATSIIKFFWGGEEEDNRECVDGGVTVRASRTRPNSRNREPVAEGSCRKVNFAHPNRKSDPEKSQTKTDSRMQAWLDGQFERQEELLTDGTYQIGRSRTVIVHEIMRGDWTWDTAWSPDGNRLAVATENHHLAVIDTSSSVVWRVRHDRRISGPARKFTTHSIRSIAWGSQYIAIGGTGDTVSILGTKEPYPILHTIVGVGFVGTLDWKADSAVLAIGTRLDKAILVELRACKTGIDGEPGGGRQLESEILHTIERKHWVNAVAFSPDGTFLAIGDASGLVSVYHFDNGSQGVDNWSHIKTFCFDDGILDVNWSPDSQWLHAGGEDFKVSMIDTNYWEVEKQIPRDRWVQFVSPSKSGSHVAVGGVSSEVSIMEVGQGWNTAMKIELNGLVPLSARWHPKDQYLALTGQNDSILAVETTTARHIAGHFLRSISPILAVDFSPDGRTAVIGNEMGIVTFYKLSGPTFVTIYELVVTESSNLSIRWSPNGDFVAIGSHDTLMIVACAQPDDMNSTSPPNASGFSIRRLIRRLGEVRSVSIDCRSRYIAVSGEKTRVYDAHSDFTCVLSFRAPKLTFANAWSPDARWMATIGMSGILTIYDTDCEKSDPWREIFSLHGVNPGMALAWGPTIVGGLLYLAFGGQDKAVTIVEIRTNEGTWETVLCAPRGDVIYDLDWNCDGLLSVAVGDGTVSIIDLSYLQSGMAVNEMDYNWQRQALTCFTEIRRNRGKNCMRSVRWIPSIPGSYSLLAIGGTDGELEIIDLTERNQCKGYSPSSS